MAKPEIEQHPLEPFLPANAQLLMLGSFPPQKNGGQWTFTIPIGTMTCGALQVSCFQ